MRVQAVSDPRLDFLVAQMRAVRLQFGAHQVLEGPALDGGYALRREPLQIRRIRKGNLVVAAKQHDRAGQDFHGVMQPAPDRFRGFLGAFQFGDIGRCGDGRAVGHPLFDDPQPSSVMAKHFEGLARVPEALDTVFDPFL